MRLQADRAREGKRWPRAQTLVASPGGACEIFKLGNMWRRWVGGSMLKDGERGGEEIRNNTEEEEC